MKHEMFIANAMRTPWAMHPDVLASYASSLVQKLAATPNADMTTIEAALAGVPRGRPVPARSAQGSIAVIPLHGAIMQRAGMMELCGGGTSTDTFGAAFREALADDSISQILIDIDSPGGSVHGIGELADEIYQARQQKPVVAFANSTAASAAYWVGSAASEFYMTPGGEVGSIGIVMAHRDLSEAMAKAGVKTTFISAGRFKTEGNPTEPLSKDALDYLKSRTADYYNTFTENVARGRGVSTSAVRNGMGQARMLGAKAAKAENMADGVMTFGDVIKKMQRGAGTTRIAMPQGSARPALRSAQLALAAQGYGASRKPSTSGSPSALQAAKNRLALLG